MSRYIEQHASTHFQHVNAQLFKQFQDNLSFRGWLRDIVFGLTYEE